MDNDETYVPMSLAKETGKAFVLGTASSAGIWAGIFLVAWAYGLNEKRKERKNQKSPTNET